MWKYNEAEDKAERTYGLVAPIEFYETGYVRGISPYQEEDDCPFETFTIGKLDSSGDYWTISSKWADGANNEVEYYLSVNSDDAEKISEEKYLELMNKYIPEDKKIELDYFVFTKENVKAVK